MVDELRPCPFCGGEAYLVDDYSSEHDHTFYQVWHECTTNPGAIRHTYGHALSLQISTPWCANEKDAVLLWNRRVERTSRYVYDKEISAWRCSKCGGLEPVGDHVRYCPDCGARIEEEADE